MSFISAGNTTTTTLVVNGDTTGNLVFNTGGANTTALTLTNAQNATFANSTSSASFIPSGSTVPTNGVYLPAANAVGIATNTSEAMRLDASSRLLVGTTTNTYGGHQLYYNPGANGWSSAVVNTKTDNATVTNGLIVKYTNVSPSDTNYMFLCQDSSSTNRFFVQNNGTTGGTSDRTLKKNIEPTRDGYVEDLCKLRIVKYNWKTQSEETPKELGWIAQEVEEVFPQMISTDKETGYKSVRHSVFVPMLIKAIQELNAKVDAQAAEIAALKAGA